MEGTPSVLCLRGSARCRLPPIVPRSHRLTRRAGVNRKYPRDPPSQTWCRCVGDTETETRSQCPSEIGRAEEPDYETNRNGKRGVWRLEKAGRERV